MVLAKGSMPRRRERRGEDLEAAIRLDPNYEPAWGLLAWINMVDIWNHFTGEWDMSRIDAVAGQFRHAIELAPNRAKPYQGLSQAVLTMGDLEQALKLSCRAIELAPSDPDCLLFHAVTLFESGDLSGAAKSIESALELHPMRPSYYSCPTIARGHAGRSIGMVYRTKRSAGHLVGI